MQNSTRVLVAAALVVAMLAGACAGIAYQKEQPVELVISWYNATENTASFDVVTLTQKSEYTLVTDPALVYHNIQISHVNDH
jgi:hypothetical protein